MPQRSPLKGIRPGGGPGRVPSGTELLGVVAAAFGFYLFLALIGLRALTADLPESPHARQNIAIIAMAMETVALLLPIWVLLVLRRGYDWADFLLVPCERMWRMRALAIGVLALPLGIAFTSLIRQVGDAPDTSVMQKLIAPPGFSGVAAVTVILWAGIVIPLAEEIFFRGLLFRWLRARMSFPWAAGLSAAAFGIIHFRFEVVVVAFAIGVVQAWLVERSGSIMPAVLLHQTYNSLALALAYAAVGAAS